MDRKTRTQPRQLRSPREIGLMRRAGLVVWEAHQAAAALVQPGVTTKAIDEAIVEVFRRHNATPLFMGYPGKTPFPAATCISINEEIVHGIPGPRQLREGDIVSIDTGCSVGGWCADAAVTHPVGLISPAAKKLLQVTHADLNLAIELLAKEKRWSQIARQMQKFVQREGFSIVETLVGHGIGRKLHEAPQVPNYYEAKHAADDFDIRPGLVIAIEPMINVGSKETRTLADDWTIVTADRSLSAHFEHTVAVTENGILRLTDAPDSSEVGSVPPERRNASAWFRW